MRAYQVRESVSEDIKNDCDVLQDILTNIAILLGADHAQAAKDMHDVIAFEIELSMVRHCDLVLWLVEINK